ncbi:MAG: 2'-5' RNA ligase family protein [Cyanobacteria bacterium J06641_5]
MTDSSALFFLALLPPPALQAQLTALKQEFATRFASRHALKSPPHITVFPPFQWPLSRVPQFDRFTEFTRQHGPIPITVSGFGAFAPRVIYAHPLKTPALLALHRNLQAFLADRFDLVDPMAAKRPYSPHLTLAFRDLTKENFQVAWPKFKTQSLQAEFVATHLTLLQHDGRCWEIMREWPLSGSERPLQDKS